MAKRKIVWGDTNTTNNQLDNYFKRVAKGGGWKATILDETPGSPTFGQQIPNPVAFFDFAVTLYRRFGDELAASSHIKDAQDTAVPTATQAATTEAAAIPTANETA